MGETDIPAEQPETEEETRVSSPDAQSSGPRRDSPAANQGPLQAFRLIWRVRDQPMFRALARGRRCRVGALEVSAVVVRSAPEPPRVAYAVGRSVGDAVTRNRVRRRLRAAVREHRPGLQAGHAYLVRAAPTAAEASYAELSDALRAIFADLARSSR